MPRRCRCGLSLFRQCGFRHFALSRMDSSSEEYAALNAGTEKRGSRMFTSPEAYRKALLFPEFFPAIADLSFFSPGRLPLRFSASMLWSPKRERSWCSRLAMADRRHCHHNLCRGNFMKPSLRRWIRSHSLLSDCRPARVRRISPDGFAGTRGGIFQTHF